MNYQKLLSMTGAFAAGMSLLLGAGQGQTSLAASTGSNKPTTSATDTKAKSKKVKTPAQETESYNLMTKVAGSKNYKVWKTVSDGQPQGKVADGINFRYNHLQSNQSIKTKKYTYWLIYVDGRRVGWVNQRYFARNTIAVPKTVSLVRNNSGYTFNPSDAISYATDATGTVVDNSQVTLSKSKIDCSTPKTYKVKYSYGSAKATSQITVRKSTKEGIGDANAVSAQKGTDKYAAWKSHYNSSLNYISPQEFEPEKNTHTYTSSDGDLTFTTRLFQPVLLSVKTDTDDGNINRVGHIPEGLTVSNGWAYTSLLSHTDLMDGHIVGYNLNKLKNPYNPQYLLTMKQKKFNTYVENIKVSPYIPIGHGQALGSSKNYVYALVNDHTLTQSTDSEELVQIRKSDMLINKMWTIKTWNGSSSDPRYFQNAVVVSDHQMFAVYHDSQNKRYEFWELDRTGDNWYPKLVGATSGNFVNNGSPVQGFTYDPVNHNFYLGFNDLIFKLGENGSLKHTYQFTTGRETEGLSVSDDRLYVNLAQRAELIESMKID